MKNTDPKPKHSPLRRGLLIWLIQFASMLAFAAIVALTLALGKIPHGICLWGLTPIAGAVSACLATKRGLNNYAAWIAPPLMLIAGYFLIWHMLPQPGPVLLCAFISLIGAATGQVLKTGE